MLNDPKSKYLIMCVGSLPDLVKELMDKVNTTKDPTQLNVIRGKVLDGARRAIKRQSFDPERP